VWGVDEMVKLLNVKLLIFIIVVAVLGVGLLVWSTRGPVTTEPLPELPAVKVTPVMPQPVAPRHTLRAPLPQVIKLPVYQYDGDVVANFSSRWPNALGFSGEPQEIEDALEGTLLLWSKEGETLVVAADGSRLSYRVDLSTETHPTGVFGSFLPSFEAAAEIVGGTLTELGSTSELLEHEAAKNKALKVGVEYVRETTVDQAELLEIHFTAKIDNYLLYLPSGPEQDAVLAWVGRNGKLLRLEYCPLGTVGEKIADYPVKDEEELRRDLERGKGTVVSSSLEGGEEIVSVTITKVSLGYLRPQFGATVIQPIFVLSGQAKAASGKTGTVTLYLPAATPF